MIKEELSKSQRAELNKLKAKDQQTPDDEEKIKDLEHQWVKEAKLSSALQERYGIADENSVGKVLWHSLNESGEIGVYDMKFGDTIVRNLTEADLDEKKKKLHEHTAQETNDPKRGSRRWENFSKAGGDTQSTKRIPHTCSMYTKYQCAWAFKGKGGAKLHKPWQKLEVYEE